MQHNWTLGLCGLTASIAFTLAASGQDPAPGTGGDGAAQGLPVRQVVIGNFLNQYPGAELYEIGGRITRVYGTSFGGGATAKDAAEQFRLRHVGMFGIKADDLLPVAWHEGGQHLQPIMFENGQPKFTGVNYTQTRDGLNVYRASLTTLVRNLPGYPVVLASANLRDIGAFTVSADAIRTLNAQAGIASARRMMPRGSVFQPATPVIFAGVDDQIHPATLALNFVGEGGSMANGDFTRREFVTDAATGQILYTESLIYDIDVTGTVTGLVTDGFVAGVCANENAQPLPYLRVSLGATNVWANALGQFTIPNGGSTDVTLSVPLIGQFFTVNNTQAPSSVVTQTATPGVPATILHNAANAGADEQQLAEVNAYRHANIARDLVLTYNPAYPTVATQSGFPINVNSTAGTCNAFYSASTINFYLSGGGCNNTAFGSVVHHEYGHNVVAKGGSGQGAYGEGMSDVLGLLVTENPVTGIGFQNCANGIRTAANSCQYLASGCSTCGSAVHACGNLISGCVWDLRANLLATHPGTYRQILGDLVINSILLHGPVATIDPAISLDYMTLDDDDANLANGTPHRTQIHNAFAAHGMAIPVQFTFPLGRPTYVNPNGTTKVRVVLSAGTQSPISANLHANTGSGFVTIPMSSVAANTFEASIPASACGSVVQYYITGLATAGASAVTPSTAPTASYSALSAASLGATAFSDNFQNNLNWTITSDATLTAGAWQRGVPITNCNRGNPLTDGDGSGQCYVTSNSSANACDSDVDGGATILTSPNMDASAPSILTYWRWYSNVVGGAPNTDTMPVEISWNGGTTWQTLETVGPVADAGGGWVQKQWNLTTLPGYTATTQLRIRFIAQDTGTGSVVEAGVDGVTLQQFNCGVPGDIDNNGDVNTDDLLLLLGAWGPCPGCPSTPCAADIAAPGNCAVDTDDLLLLLANWG